MVMMKYKGRCYHMDPLGVLGMATFSMGVKILRTQHLEMNWNQRLDLR